MRTISVGTVCINISQIAANIDINLEVRLNSKKKTLQIPRRKAVS